MSGISKLPTNLKIEFYNFIQSLEMMSILGEKSLKIGAWQMHHPASWRYIVGILCL